MAEGGVFNAATVIGNVFIDDESVRAFILLRSQHPPAARTNTFHLEEFAATLQCSIIKRISHSCYVQQQFQLLFTAKCLIYLKSNFVGEGVVGLCSQFALFSPFFRENWIFQFH